MPYMCAMCDKKPVSLTKPEPGVVLMCQGCVLADKELMKINNPYWSGDKKPKTKVVNVKMTADDFVLS